MALFWNGANGEAAIAVTECKIAGVNEVIAASGGYAVARVLTRPVAPHECASIQTADLG